MWEVCPPPPCEVDREEAAAAAAPAEDGEGRREAMLPGTTDAALNHLEGIRMMG